MSRDYVLQPFHAAIQLQIDYQRELNGQQFAAVTAPPGPALVIAGAGSGKTRTLTYRVAYLLEQGIPADRILLLTFTNKAAGEMMRRVADLLGQKPASLWGGTFHSIGNRILRQHAPLLGYPRDFTILDRDDASQLIKACRAALDIDVKGTRFPKAEVLGDIFSLAVNTHRTVPEILNEQYDYFSELAPQIAEAHQRYAARKLAAHSLDFDDLLALWLRLLQENQPVREHYQRRFQFILVDEYQDTNKLQSDLIDLLAARHHNIMAVGDDAQSIYGWRGANFQNILKFPERHPETRIYKIETNYRSTPEILNAANAAIAMNLHQFAKALAPARKSGRKPVLVTCHDASEQAAFVAQRVLELHDEGADLNRIAVLYRSHFHALELQLELTRRNIPFSITSGLRFFEQAHIKDVTAYLKLAANPRDELAFKRIVQLLPGIGGQGANKLWTGLGLLHSNTPLTRPTDTLSPSDGERFHGLRNAADGAPEPASHGRTDRPPPAARPNATPGAHGVTRPTTRFMGREGVRGVRQSLAMALQACAKSVPKNAASGWAQLVATVAQLEEKSVRGSAAKMIQLVIEAGYDDYLKENYANYHSRLDDLKQLAIFSQQFPSIEDFLTQLALLTNVEAEDDLPATRDEERIRLSTIHQAKGLEFDVVFVIMMCDGLFPSARSFDRGAGEEEERRLFYVAITRARNELYLSYPLIRAGYGNRGDTFQQPSRFLAEIPRELLDEWNLRTFNPHG
jgi:DNA helicase-2/ATP-dependent DNA helicase PcrA